MSEKKHIFCLRGRKKTDSGNKRQEGMTQDEYDLRNVNPYDLLQVYSMMKKMKKK